MATRNLAASCFRILSRRTARPTISLSAIKMPSAISPQLTTGKALLSTCPVLEATATVAESKPRSCPFAAAAGGRTLDEDPTLCIPEKYRHKKLNDETRALIKASIPALEAYGFDITRLFYHNMLESHQTLKDVFNNANQEHMKQPRALAQAVLAYARNIDDLTPLTAAVELMAVKHVSLYIRPEQYAIVGTHLIEAIGKVLGDAVTAELAEAWTAAYWQLAEILITREHQLYQESGDWTDWADFRIAKKVKESSEVTSFYLEPVHESLTPLPTFMPGQFISIQVEVPSIGHMQTRQYSLSAAPDPKHYRISIKREVGPEGTPQAGTPGLISNLMHDAKNEGDVIRVSHPSGDFFLEPESNTPLVLLSGGIGLTPLISMLDTLVSKQSKRLVSWVHGAKSSEVRAFTKHIRQLEGSANNLHVTLFEDQPGQDEVEGNDYSFRGFVDLSKLNGEEHLFLQDADTQYYICGPVDFMSKTEATLLEYGVKPDKIFMERFGTGGLQRVM